VACKGSASQGFPATNPAPTLRSPRETNTPQRVGDRSSHTSQPPPCAVVKERPSTSGDRCGSAPPTTDL
jgi:hypothetical protein